MVAHSEKEHAAPTFKKTFGHHPMLAFCDNTGEFLAAQLRRGNVGANTAIDHVTILGDALAQILGRHRYGRPILVRTDTAGCSKAFLAHIRVQRDRAVAAEFSVGWSITDRERVAIGLVPKTVWADGVGRRCGPTRSTPMAGIVTGAGLVEITGLLPAVVLAGYRAGTGVIVCRERPHPGA